MNKLEYIETVDKEEINIERKKEIEELFNCTLDSEIAKVISLADKIDFFDEERRALSYSEILDASELLGISATDEGMIPVVDAYDCTYIVYLIQEKKWAKYNTIDQVTFKEKDSLKEVI